MIECIKMRGLSFILVYLCILQLECQIPSDNYLFGTTRKNVIWFQNGTFDWTESSKPPNTTAIQLSHNFLGVYGTSYFHDRNFLVFSDTGAKTIFIIDAINRRAVFAYIGTSSSVGHLAVDWLSGNVYWCDSAFDWIGMIPLPSSLNSVSSFNDKFKVVIDKYLDVPSGIAVQPSHQWIFWTDIGLQPKIERSLLDGSNRLVLVLHGLIKPLSITIDSNQYIYWTDPVRGTIESCDFYGNNRKILRTNKNARYFGIEVWKNYIYVSEQNNNEILVFADTDGHQIHSYSPGGQNVSSIAIYTAENQFVNNDACANKGCQHICLVGSIDQASCTCQDGFMLHSDGKQCTAEAQVLKRSIVYVNGSKICAIPVTHINSYQHVTTLPDCTVGGVASGIITHLAINVADDEIYFNVGRTINQQKFYQTASVLYTAANTVTGLTFDWTTRQLYWTVSQSDHIFNASLPINQATQITTVSTITLLQKPTYITINPIESVLFVISGVNAKQIDAIYTNDSKAITLVTTTELTNPKWLTYDRPSNRLYWTDVTKRGSVTSFGENIKIQDVSGLPTLHGIIVYKDYILLLQSNVSITRMYVDEINFDDEPYSFPMEDLQNPTTFVIYDKNIQPQRNVPCVKDNSGCQQICVVYGYYPKCECNFGYQLQADLKSCVSELFITDYFITIDKLHNRLFNVLNASKISSINTGSIQPIAVAFDYSTSTVFWIDEGANTIKSIKTDGTSELTLTTESSQLSSLDVDQSTSNIYYTTGNAVKVYSAKYATKRSLITNILNPNHITLFPSQGKMFWVEPNNGQPTIKQAFMDGTNIEMVVSYVPNRIKSPSDLVIDIGSNRLIWSDDIIDKIESISLVDINNRTVLRSGTGDHPVAIDVDDQYVYSIGADQRSAIKITKQASTAAQIMFSSVKFGRLISLYKVTTTRISQHSLCMNRNGQCSRLCLPRGPKQRTCQCHEGQSISTDGRTCIGDTQCPERHGNAVLDEHCSRYVDVSCSYECENGYQKSPHIAHITCLINGTWNTDSALLCSSILCPEYFDSGKVSSGCNRYVGYSCGVTCEPGYQNQVSSIYCQDNGQWNEDTTLICRSAEAGKNSGQSMSTGGIVGMAIGGIALLIIVVAVVVVCFLQKMRKERKQTRNEMSVIYQAQVNGAGAYLYPTHTTIGQTEEVYDEIKDEQLYHDKMDTAKALSESSSSNRYSHWPQKDDPPDYLEVVGAAGGNSPYAYPRMPGNYYSRNPGTADHVNPAFEHGNNGQNKEDDGYITPNSSIVCSSTLQLNPNLKY